jgi:hypothetical protein
MKPVANPVAYSVANSKGQKLSTELTGDSRRDSTLATEQATAIG